MMHLTKKGMRRALAPSLSLLLLCSFGFASLMPANAQETATMTAVPSQTAVYFGDTFTVDIVINASTVGTASCWLIFNATQLEAVSVSNGNMFSSLAYGTIDNVNGTINDIYGWSAPPPVAGRTLATITFRAKGVAGAAVITLNPYGCYVPPYTLALTNAVVEVGLHSVYVIMAPAHQTIGSGEKATIDVMVNPTVNELAVMTFKVVFNETIFEVTNVTDRRYFDTSVYRIDNVNGTVSIWAFQAPIPPGVTGTGTLATIELTPKNTGTTEVTMVDMTIIDVNDNELVFNIENATLEASLADLDPPVVTFGIGTPHYNDGVREWVTPDTPLYINATDATDYIIQYRIFDNVTMTWTAWYVNPLNTNVSFHLTSQGVKYYVEYKAEDNLGNPSVTGNVTLYVSTAPMTTISLAPSSPDGNNGWYRSTVTVTLTATDASGSGIAATYYKVDTSAWTQYTGTAFSLSADGIHTVYYYSEDNNGNIESHKQATVKIDRTSPSVTVTISPSPVNGIYASAVTVHIAGTDTGGSGMYAVKYRLDGGSEQTVLGSGYSFVVASEGTHTVSCSVVDNAGNSGTQQQTSFVIQLTPENKNPTANFTFTPANPTDLQTVTFVDHSTDEDGNETIISWTWDFGDGATSTQQNPSHQYTANGIYVVKLTVKDNNNATAIIQKTITVTNVGPTSLFTYTPEKPKIDEVITFTSHSTDQDGSITAWLWNFGDNTTSTLHNSTTHKYEKTGTYTVTLTVTDNDGATHQRSVTVKVTKETINIMLYAIAIIVLIIIAIAVLVMWWQRRNRGLRGLK